ncbi:MAG TPA: hypothetical protein VHB46_05340, partial [Burkholderiales bacterium]|nr:hypothetical protein [Burkholderiales bacterium]
MPRPNLPRGAWQAIAAVAGTFTLVSVVAAPVDLWRLTVKSHQGEPFFALATIASTPEENISDACLSMGPESDAPGSEVPFLGKADLKLDAAHGTVAITTNEPIVSPALELVLRVQCEGAPLYARHFSALIPPAGATARTSPAAQAPAPATTQTIARPASRRPGFRLSILPGDTLDEIAEVLFPGQRAMQQELVRQVVAGNPQAFPGGRAREVAAGTVLWFPNLQDVRGKPGASSAAKKPSGAPRAAARKAAAPAEPPAAVVAHEPAPARTSATLRRALDLGDKPGPQECRELMQLCGAPAALVTDDKAASIESNIKQLSLKQGSIDQQLQQLEQSLVALQKAVNSMPAAAAAPPSPPAPPKVEIRTVTKTVMQTEPVEWYVWAGLAVLVLAAAAGGFAYGRRGSTLARDLRESDAQLDRMLAPEPDEQLNRMLAKTATVIREFESNPRMTAVEMPPPPPKLPTLDPEHRAGATDPAPPPASTALPDIPFDAPAKATTTDVDVPLDTGKPVEAQVPGLSNDVLFEMDQALDNTRSMFTDVDRFIALGRTQNALSLLQFQVHKDPKDRDSWIKLMAIYRQEKM